MREGQDAYLTAARAEAERYIGGAISDEQWEAALPKAKYKLDWIIEHYGDHDGERRKPYYLGKLVEEHIGAVGFSKYLDAMNAINELNRQMKETPECIKCGFKCVDDPDERSRLLSETAPYPPTLYTPETAEVKTAASA